MWFGDETFTREIVLEKLKSEFKKRQEKNSLYSMRAFARDLAMDYSLLAKILKEERQVSWSLAVHLKDYLDFQGDKNSP